jgi:hypothetical protein
MWDTVDESTAPLSREMPCPWCRHASHSALPCSDHCDCTGWRRLSRPGSCVPGGG